MTRGPILRVNGSILEVIQSGYILDRYQFARRGIHLHIDLNGVEIISNGRLLDRYSLGHGRGPVRSGHDRELTEISVDETEPANPPSTMFY